MKLKLVEIMNINQIVQAIINDAVCNDPLFKFKLLGISKTLQTYVDDFGVIRNDKIKESCWGYRFGISLTELEVVDYYGER